MNMKQLLKLIPITGLLTSMIGCNIASKITEKAVERKQNSLWLYYAVTPLIENMTGFDGETATFVPDFVNYPTDWAKFGLKSAVSKISWGRKTWTEMKFNESGKLTYVGNWFDEQRRYGDPIGFNYDESGKLRYMYNKRGIVDGSDLSRHSQHYGYDSSGRLISRDYGTYSKSYHYYDNGKLKSVDFVPRKEHFGHYYGEGDVYFACDDKGDITTMKRRISGHLLFGSARGELCSSYIHGDDGLCMGRKDTYILENNKIDSICSIESYTYNEYGDLASWTHESIVYPSKKTADAFTLDFDYAYDEAGNWIKKVVKGDMIESLKSDLKWYGNIVKGDDGSLQLECYRTIKYYTDTNCKSREQE